MNETTATQREYINMIERADIMRKGLFDIKRRTCCSWAMIAKDIAISPVTLYRFIEGKEAIRLISLSKIEEYVLNKARKFKENTNENEGEHENK